MTPDPRLLHRLARPPGWIILLLLLGLSMQPAVAAQTYYVRTDGGSARQCTGLADAPYPGNGSGQACAWNSPLVALPTDDATRIDGGDTLVIGPGDYMIGWGAPGLEESRRCYTEARYDCYPAAVPSGTGPTTRTRILGKGHDSGCTAPPRLWGTERVDQVLNLEGSNHVEVGCLEITDRSDCIEFHTDDRVRCERDDAPYGDWASIGIWARDSRDAWLHDLDIHGLSGRGIMAGGLRDWTIERVRINANGWAGWDGDIGDGSSNAGDMVFRDVEIAWNGCGERWKTGEVHACWAQETGGYGDGLGTAETGGRWLFEDTRVHHNTSDGIDLLYLDEAATTSSTFRRVRAVANAGNQIKTIGTAWIENSVIVGSCAYFYKKFDMTWSDQCRAMGNAVSIGATNGQVTTLVHNTITGEGDCLVLTSGGDQTARVDIQNNVFVGAVDFLADADGNPGELTCGHYADESRATVRFSGNAFWNVKGGQCPPGGNLCGKDPRLAGMALDDFEPMPLPGSPLIDRATPRDGVGADFLGQPRLEGPATDIGAVEFRGDAPTVSAAKAATTDGTARRPPRNRNGHAAAGFWDRLYDGAAFGCNAIRIAGQSLAGAGCLVSIHMARRSLGWILDRR